jgi:hypothetical protein
MKHVFLISVGEVTALASASWNFSTGNDSPVRLPWLTKRSLAESTRTSPGIMSPADRLIISRGYQTP